MAFNPKGTQLRLFMDPEEHIASVQHSVDGPMSTPLTRTALWNKKESEARQPLSTARHGAGLYDSVKEHGLTSHVTVVEQSDGSWTHAEGHHRAAAAAAVQRDTGRSQFVPVNYVPHDAGKYPGSRGYEPPESNPHNYDQRKRDAMDANWRSAQDAKRAGKRKAMGLDP